MIFNTTYIRIMDYWFYCIAKLDAMPAYVYVYSKYVEGDAQNLRLGYIL